MKQIKVSNPKLQKFLDGITGWREWLIVAFFVALAIISVWLASKPEAAL